MYRHCHGRGGWAGAGLAIAAAAWTLRRRGASSPTAELDRRSCRAATRGPRYARHTRRNERVPGRPRAGGDRGCRSCAAARARNPVPHRGHSWRFDRRVSRAAGACDQPAGRAG